MTSELDLDKIRRSAEPGAMFGAIIVRDLVDHLEQAEQAVGRVREVLETEAFEVHEYATYKAVPVEYIEEALDGDGRG